MQIEEKPTKAREIVLVRITARIVVNQENEEKICKKLREALGGDGHIESEFYGMVRHK